MTMKKVVTVTKVEGEGLVSLLGQRVTLFCSVYIYTGNLEGVNDECVFLSDPAIVYETGAFHDKTWKDAQNLPNSCYVMKQSIESFMVLK